MTERPKAKNSLAERELDKAKEQIDAFESEVKSMTLDRMNQAPKEETEPQHRLSTREQQNAPGIYLKPSRSIGAVNPKTGQAEKFNDNFRADWEFQKELVNFIAENRELTGEPIEIWTKPFAGVPAEFWTVPTNKPVWGPRYLAEQITRCTYHRLMMNQDAPSNLYSAGYGMEARGQLVVETTVQRLNAHPVSQKKSLFMGASGF